MAEQRGPNPRPVVLAMTGASGVVYATRLLESLLCKRVPVHWVVSQSGQAVIRQELEIDCAADGSNVVELLESSDRLLKVSSQDAISAETAAHSVTEGLLSVHHCEDYFTPIASGSFLTSGMVVCPCSGSTLSGIAHASSQNLIQRAADVHLKERRKLIVVPRETPLNTFHLENMHRLSQHGVCVLPASPGWYHGVSRLLDLVDFVVARILDQLDIDHTQMARWEDGSSAGKMD